MPANASAIYNFTLDMDDFLEPQPLGPDPYDPYNYNGGDIDYSYVPFAGYWISDTSFYSAVGCESYLTLYVDDYGYTEFDVWSADSGSWLVGFTGYLERTDVYDGQWYGLLDLTIVYNDTAYYQADVYGHFVIRSGDSYLEVIHMDGTPLLSGLDGYFSDQIFYNNGW